MIVTTWQTVLMSLILAALLPAGVTLLACVRLASRRLDDAYADGWDAACAEVSLAGDTLTGWDGPPADDSTVAGVVITPAHIPVQDCSDDAVTAVLDWSARLQAEIETWGHTLPPALSLPAGEG